MSFRLTPLAVLVATDPKRAKDELVQVLAEEGGDIRATASRLDVSRQCIYNWVGKLGIDLGRPRR